MSFVTKRTVQRGAIMIGVTPPAMLVATPAFAVTQDDGSDPGHGLTALQTLLIYAGIPIGLFLLITLLVMAPSIARGPRYRTDRAWNAQPRMFGFPEHLGDTAPGAPAELTAAETGETTPSKDDGGGASARW